MPGDDIGCQRKAAAFLSAWVSRGSRTKRGTNESRGSEEEGTFVPTARFCLSRPRRRSAGLSRGAGLRASEAVLRPADEPFDLPVLSFVLKMLSTSTIQEVE